MVFNNGHVFRGGKYEVLINSGTGDTGIQDLAGNALDGNFYGSFPSGDGLPGGNFVATVSTFHRVVLPFVPSADGYVSPNKGIDPPAGSGSASGSSHSAKTHTETVKNAKSQKAAIAAFKFKAIDRGFHRLASRSFLKRQPLNGPA